MMDNDLDSFFLLRAQTGLSRFSSPASKATRPPRTTPPPDPMHLVSCARPIEPLEDAPRSSLLTESASGQWSGFWSTTTEGYYARWTRADGGEEWFRMVEEPATQTTRKPTPTLGVRMQSMPAPVRANARRRVMLLLARSSSARGILVGNARPKSR